MIATSMIDRSVAVEIPMIGPRLVDLRAEQAADRTGQALTEIERLPFDLSALEQEGIFLNVDARSFGLLDRRLDWQALGVSCRAPATSPFARLAAGSCRIATGCHCCGRRIAPTRPCTSTPITSGSSRRCLRRQLIDGCPGAPGPSSSVSSTPPELSCDGA